MNPKSLYRAALLECLSYVCSDEAYAAYRKLAKKGCPDGWFGLGNARQYGEGVKQNLTKAEKYYSAAKKTLRQPACFIAKQPKRGAPKPNAPSATYTMKASVCPETTPKPTNGTPAPPYKRMKPPATT